MGSGQVWRSGSVLRPFKPCEATTRTDHNLSESSKIGNIALLCTCHSCWYHGAISRDHGLFSLEQMDRIKSTFQEIGETRPMSLDRFLHPTPGLNYLRPARTSVLSCDSPPHICRGIWPRQWTLARSILSLLASLIGAFSIHSFSSLVPIGLAQNGGEYFWDAHPGCCYPLQHSTVHVREVPDFSHRRGYASTPVVLPLSTTDELLDTSHLHHDFPLALISNTVDRRCTRPLYTSSTWLGTSLYTNQGASGLYTWSSLLGLGTCQLVYREWFFGVGVRVMSRTLIYVFP